MVTNLVDIAEFHSDKFAPVLSEDSQVNPEVYGAELAYWLCQDLARRGVETSYPEAEDWGWYITFITPAGDEFAVHCGNIGSAKDQWLLSLHRYGRGLFGRNKPSWDLAAPLIAAIRSAVYEAVAHDRVEWRWDTSEPTS